MKEYVFSIFGDDSSVCIVSQQDIENLFELIVKATKENKKFLIYEVGQCVGDFT